MISVMWGGIAAIVGLLILVGESLLGLHNAGVSHANVLLWLIISPIAVVGSMVHRRMSTDAAFRYGAALTTGIITSASAMIGLSLVWLLFINVMYPDYFGLMHRYAEAEARAQGHTGALLAQEIHVGKLIFAVPAFYLLSSIIPLLVGTIASFVGAIGIRKQ